VCGRYTLATPDPAAVRARFPVGEDVEIRRRFNVAPADDVLAVTTDREGRPRGELLRWGLVPSWADTPDSRLKMINARVETVTERPAFRTAFERYRCLIVADGFYEWNTPPDGGRKQAFHIARSDGELFAFAGLWSIWRPPGGDGPKLRSCTILTTTPNSAVAPLHDRMPVILDRGAEDAWLDPDTPRPLLLELLTPLPSEQTSVTAVGSAVNDARYDGPECLAPATATAAAGSQSTLF
jgi:putative SOS response-associated peptidase YedK